MFVCDQCHEKHYGETLHFSGSYGPCEVCGKTRSCSDCHCPEKKTAKAEPKEER